MTQMWGIPWAEGQQKNEVHFEKTQRVMRDLFESFDNFQSELGNRFTFLDLACAPGGFAKHVCKDPRCDRGWGVTLPVNEGGFKLLFTWNTPEERKFRVKFRDMLTMEPWLCCDQLVDLCVSDAQYLPLRKTDQPGPDPSLARVASQNPSLGIWALLFQQLRLGLSNLREGGVMLFRLNCKDENVEWYREAVCRLLSFLDCVFSSMAFFKSGASHQADGTFQVICRGFCRREFEAMGAAELLRQSMNESMHESDVERLEDVAIFRGLHLPQEIHERTDEILDSVRQLIARYLNREQEEFSHKPTVKEYKCIGAHPHIERMARDAVLSVLPLAASTAAAAHLEGSADDIARLRDALLPPQLKHQQLEDTQDETEEQSKEQGEEVEQQQQKQRLVHADSKHGGCRDELSSFDALRCELAERANELVRSLRARAEELQAVLVVARSKPPPPRSEDVEDRRGRVRVNRRQGATLSCWRPQGLGGAEYQEPPPNEFIVVADLPAGTTEADLDMVVSKVGELVETHIFPEDFAAIVRMQTREQAERARLELDGIVPDEITKAVVVQFHQKNGVVSADHLYVRGLPHTATSQQLASLFSRHGTVLWCKILPVQEGKEGALERTGLVQMASTDQAQVAIQALNAPPTVHFRQPLTIRYAEPPTKEARPAMVETNRERPTTGPRWAGSKNGQARDLEGPRLWGFGLDFEERIVRDHERKGIEPELLTSAAGVSTSEGSCEDRGRKTPPTLRQESERDSFGRQTGDVDAEQFDEQQQPLARSAARDAERQADRQGVPQSLSTAPRTTSGDGKPSRWAAVAAAPTGAAASPAKKSEKSRRTAQPSTTTREEEEASLASPLVAASSSLAQADRDSGGAGAAGQAVRKDGTARVVESWEDLSSPSENGLPDTWEDLVQSDEGETCSLEPKPESRDTICLRGVPVAFPESLVEFWLKPHGTVKELRRIDDDGVETSPTATFRVQMSNAEEAASAMTALDGKSMKGHVLAITFDNGQGGDTKKAPSGINSEALLAACRAAAAGRRRDDAAGGGVVESVASRRQQRESVPSAAPAPPPPEPPGGGGGCGIGVGATGSGAGGVVAGGDGARGSRGGGGGGFNGSCGGGGGGGAATTKRRPEAAASADVGPGSRHQPAAADRRRRGRDRQRDRASGT